VEQNITYRTRDQRKENIGAGERLSKGNVANVVGEHNTPPASLKKSGKRV